MLLISAPYDVSIAPPYLAYLRRNAIYGSHGYRVTVYFAIVQLL